MKKVLFFDTETNGFQGSSVLSFSGYIVGFEEDGKFKLLETINRFYFPQEAYNENALAVNHLDEATVTEKRQDVTYRKHFLDDTELLEKIKECDKFVAHNARFDVSFLPFEVKQKDIFCTMLTNTDIVKIPNTRGFGRRGSWGGYKWPKLKETANYYKVTYDEAELHGSIYDVDVMFRVFLEMLKVPGMYKKIWGFIFDS